MFNLSEENEEMVIKVLEKYHETYELIPILPTWHRRGQAIGLLKQQNLYQHLIRCDPKQDQMNGFL